MPPIEHVVGLSAVLFTIGVVGALTRRNLIAILMSIELMLNAANLAFIAFNRVWAASPQGSAIDGQVFVLMVITVAAAEAAVGLGMVIAIVRNRDSMNVEDMSLLKW
jgi:NADH:ubiquinone oxidoreductase subunit K